MKNDIPGAGQVHHVGGEPLGRCVGRSATAVAVSQSRRTALTVGRQDAPDVARGQSHRIQWIGMDTIGIDSYPLVAGGPSAVGDLLDQRD